MLICQKYYLGEWGFMRGTKWLLFVTVIILLLVAFGCDQEGGAPDASQEKILVVAHTAEFTTWDPSAAYSTESTYMPQMYEGLLRSFPEGSPNTIEPLLATEYSVSDDGTEWIFKIREGVLFHDGETLNAEAVKKSIERTINMGEGAAFIWYPVESIEVVDEYTVKFNLSYSAPLDRIVASANGAWIMSPNAVDKEKEWFEEENREAGTGPWVLDSYLPDQEVVFTRFEDYWGGWDEQAPDRIISKFVADPVVQRQMVENGDAHIAVLIPTEAYDILAENPDINMIFSPDFYNYFIYLNTQKPPLDNKLVRQALAYCTPYQDIIDVAVSGKATQSRGIVPKGMWPYDDSLFQYTYDVEKAKELLKEAGYEDGTLGGMKMRMTYASENNTEKLFVPLVKEAFEQIGIDLDIEGILWAQQWDEAQNTEPEEAQDIFACMWWPTYPDGYENLYTLFHSDYYRYWNLGYYLNEEFDNLIDTAYTLTVTDNAKSKEMYMEAQSMLIEDSPALFLFDLQYTMPTRNTIDCTDVLNPCYPYVQFWYNVRFVE